MERRVEQASRAWKNSLRAALWAAPSLSPPGIVSGIVLGSLLAVTTGIGALLYYFLCRRNQSSWWRIERNSRIRALAPPVNNLYQSSERPRLNPATPLIPAKDTRYFTCNMGARMYTMT